MERENPSARESRRLNRLFAAALVPAMPTIGGHVVTLAAGQAAMHSGNVPTALPLVLMGRLQPVVHLGNDGQRVVPAWFEPGEIAMCSYLYATTALTVDVVAAEDSQLRWLPRAVIEATIQARGDLLLPLAQFLAQRLREVQARERVWLQRGVRGRVWAALQREVGGDAPQAGDAWRVDLSHEALAERAGASRPKVSLALKDMEREGLLRLGRGCLWLVAPVDEKPDPGLARARPAA